MSNLRELEAFRRRCGTHCSASTFHAIIAEAHKSLPSIASRQAFKRARDKRMNDDTEHCPLMQTLYLDGVDGSVVPLVFVCPFALLITAFSECKPFRDLIVSTLETHPCDFEHPWLLMLYSDEVVPGNALSHDNKPKH